MRVVNIEVKPLNKSFQVLGTAKAYRDAMEWQLLAADIQELSKQNVVENPRPLMLKTQEFMNATQDFLQKNLQLSNKQVDELYTKMDNDEVTSLTAKIAMRIQGASEKDVEEALADNEKKD